MKNKMKLIYAARLSGLKIDLEIRQNGHVYQTIYEGQIIYSGTSEQAIESYNHVINDNQKGK
jgi:hypothetical protein